MIDLRAARLAAKISLTEMARRIGFTKGYLSGIENGKETPSEKVLRGYEQVLGVELESFTTSREPKSVLYYGRAKGDILCGVQLQREALEKELREVMETMRDLPEQPHRTILLRTLEQTQDHLTQRIIDLTSIESTLDF